MEAGPIFYFILLLLIGFLAYIVLQCAIIWLIRCCCPNPNRRQNAQFSAKAIESSEFSLKRKMSLTSNLIVALGFLFAIFVISQLIYLAMRMHHSMALNRQRQLQRQRLDRQNNVELGRQHSRYGDIFFIEPNSQEAARIREQLEKDDKDLPSYDEVMRICNLTSPTAAAALPTPTMETPISIGIAALPAPPYSETDPNPTPDIATHTDGVTARSLEPAPSTSRAAQITQA